MNSWIKNSLLSAVLTLKGFYGSNRKWENKRATITVKAHSRIQFSELENAYFCYNMGSDLSNKTGQNIILVFVNCLGIIAYLECDFM